MQATFPNPDVSACDYLKKIISYKVLETRLNLLSIPEYFSNLGLFASYEQMREMGELARCKYEQVLTEHSSLGILYIYPENILDACLDQIASLPEQYL